jgi:hypothetical protein
MGTTTSLCVGLLAGSVAFTAASLQAVAQQQQQQKPNADFF